MPTSTDDAARHSILDDALGVPIDLSGPNAPEQVTLARQALRPIALAAEVGTSLTRERTLEGALGRCVESIVRHLDAAFARIWTLDEPTQTLVLRASAGLYTHVDGPHARVPVGAFKIGLIAQERAPHLTNDVASDPRVGDKAWAAREGMVAFAGYPLMVGERVVGVLAMFARVPLPAATIGALGSVADVIALAIERDRIGRERDELLARERVARGAAEASELQFRTLVESISQLAWMAEPDGRITWYNQRWYDYTGTTPEQMAREGWQGVQDPAELPAVQARWQRSLATGEPFDMELPLRGADGVHRWFLTRAMPLRDATGRILRWFGTNTDVDDSRHTALRSRFLAEAGARLAASLDVERTVAEVARLAVPEIADWCAVDLVERGSDGAVAGFRRLAVAHVDPAKVQLAHDLWHRLPPRPDDATGVPAVVRTGRSELVPQMPEGLLEASVPDPEMLALTRSLGLRAWMIVPLVARGNVLGALTFVLSSARRSFASADLAFAEELGRRAAIAIDNATLVRRLGHSEERYRALTEATSQMVWTTDAAGRASGESPSWYAFTGQPFDAPRDAGFSAVVHPDDAARVDALWRAAVRDRTPYEADVRVRHRDGTWRDTIARATPVRNADGSVREWVGINVDVTERRRFERERERLIDALEVSNRELDQFAYVTSHDLKAPLRGIGNLAQWIEEDLGERITDEGREHLRLLRGRVTRMEALIEGILAYSRAARVRDRVERFDTRRLLDEVVEMLAPGAGVAIAIDAALPHVTAERTPLQQVFLNLVGNAIKHARRDDARVEVRARDAGDHVEFAVTDNGPGIAAEYHERIWAIFQTLEARDRVEGTGIGLSVVKKIVETRGGRAWVESAPGAGATFRFTWPKAPEPDAETG